MHPKVCHISDGEDEDMWTCLHIIHSSFSLISGLPAHTLKMNTQQHQTKSPNEREIIVHTSVLV